MIVPQRVGAYQHTSSWFSHWLLRHWAGLFIVLYGTWISLPFLAPAAMHLGWEGPGNALYFIYSFFCHQLPERSFFLFGPQWMYSLGEIQAQWVDTINPMLLRKFIGSAEMGWKVAWSDRMISFYGSIWMAALAWLVGGRRWRGLRLGWLVVMLLPMAVDVGTHMVSDTAGLGLGFRDSNLWLSTLMKGALPASFTVGDSLGSFNSWARLLSGILAGSGIVWFAFPKIHKAITVPEGP